MKRKSVKSYQDEADRSVLFNVWCAVDYQPNLIRPALWDAIKRLIARGDLVRSEHGYRLTAHGQTHAASLGFREENPWCETCGSWHATPRNAAHRDALGCMADAGGRP